MPWGFGEVQRDPGPAKGLPPGLRRRGSSLSEGAQRCFFFWDGLWEKNGKKRRRRRRRGVVKRQPLNILFQVLVVYSCALNVVVTVVWLNLERTPPLGRPALSA